MSHRGKLEALVRKADKFAINIRTSLGSYSFDYGVRPNDPEHKRVLHQHKFCAFKIIDAETGQALPSSSVPIADDTGRIGIQLCTIFPAVLSEKSGGHKIVIAKPTILVAFDQPVRRRRGRA